MSKISEHIERQRIEAEDKRREELVLVAKASLVDVEVVPFKDAKNRAGLFLQCSSGSYRYALEIPECYGVIESLLGQGFECRACGKCELASDERWQGISGCMSSWFMLVKSSAQQGAAADRLRPASRGSAVG